MKQFLTLACLTLLAVCIASAQTLNFSTKSAFSIGNASFPAGSYQLHAADQEQMLFECTADSKGHSALFEVDSQDTVPTTSGVTFAKYGDKLILKSFTISGAGAWFVPISLVEKQAKKSGAKPTKVTAPAK